MLRTLLVASLIAIPTLAHADPDASRFGVSVGANNMEGPDLGLELTPMLTRHLELGLQGRMSLLGPTVAVIPRARLTAGPATFTVGAGLSAGTTTRFCFEADGCPSTTEAFLRADAEAGVQLTSHGGWFARAYIGDGHLIATDAMAVPEDKIDIPYGGLTIGKTF